MRGPSVGALLGAVLLASCGGGSNSGGDDGQVRNTTGDDNAFTMAGGKPFPSCYESVGISEKAPKAKRHLFVVIDRTTAFEPELVDSLREKVEDYLAEGPAMVTIDSFSAQTRDDHTKIVFEGESELPVAKSKRNSLNARKLEELDRCLASAGTMLARRAGNEVVDLAGEEPGNFASSEILASLTQVSEAVRRSPAKDKVVLVASDMLEHSSVGSFYAKKQIAMFDVRSALQRAADLDLIGDFGDARIVTMGAGLLPPDAPETATRDRQTLANLRNFWDNWFRNSEAELTDYGEPDLMVKL